MKIQIIHERDPDSECGLTVFLDGVRVQHFGATAADIELEIEDIDPGRGYTVEDYTERRKEARDLADATTTEYDIALAEALENAAFEKYGFA
jgi:hypothetical protein